MRRRGNPNPGLATIRRPIDRASSGIQHTVSLEDIRHISAKWSIRVYPRRLLSGGRHDQQDERQQGGDRGIAYHGCLEDRVEEAVRVQYRPTEAPIGNT